MIDLQNRILDAALPLVVFEGWTFASLEKAAVGLGMTAFDAKRAFPEGVGQALAVFSARADAMMVDTLRRDYVLADMKIRERIATAVMVRLRQQCREREAVRRAIGYYAMPWNAPDGLKALHATVDTMWREAGDTSTDYNFYTKRLMLAGVLKSTVAVWLEDMSDDLAETESFLRRRIENVMQIEKAKAGLRERVEKLDMHLPGFLRKWA